MHGLRCKKIISDGDLTEIRRNPDAQQQNEILHRCLKRSCDEEALVEVCDMMIAVDGNRKMNALGRKMKCKLEGKKIIDRVVCACIKFLCNWSVFVCVDGTYGMVFICTV